MNILIWLPYIPYPLDSGGNQAVYFMIDRLRQEHHISVGLDVRSHGRMAKPSAGKMQVVHQLQKCWPDVTFYLYEGQREYAETTFSMGGYARLLQSLAATMTRKLRRAYFKWSETHEEGDTVRAKSFLHEGMAHYNPGFLRFFKSVSQKGFDVVQIEMYEYLPLVYLLPQDVRKIFVHHEIRFVRNQNELGLFKQPSEIDLLAYEQNKAMEIDALKRYDKVVTLTETDRQLLLPYLAADKVVTSPAAIVQAGPSAEFKPCTEFVFVGSGGHIPNQDALHWFVDSVLPLLRGQGASIRLYVVGQWGKKERAGYLKACPEIVFPGFVDDLGAFINGKISIIPLRIGSGMRIKIVEAVRAMSPFVTTPKGVEGLNYASESECLIAADATAFAADMLRLQSDVALQRRLAVRAADVAATQYDAEALFRIRKHIY